MSDPHGLYDPLAQTHRTICTTSLPEPAHQALSPSPPVQSCAGGKRKRGSEGRWGKLSRDLNRSAKGAGCKGLSTRRKAPGSMVGRCCARHSFWRMGSGSGVREPTRFFPRAHSSATVTDTPPPPRRAARCVRVVGQLPEMATPSRVRLGWCQRRRRAAPAATARAGGHRVRWFDGLAAVEGE